MVDVLHYLRPEIIPTQLDDAMAAYMSWRWLTTELTIRYTTEIQAAERKAYSRLMSFPAYITAEAMNAVNGAGGQ